MVPRRNTAQINGCDALYEYIGLPNHLPAKHLADRLKIENPPGHFVLPLYRSLSWKIGQEMVRETDLF